jgi:peptidoglycan/xylan/chitin deacetylase (PgdA/CDA1 family)
VPAGLLSLRHMHRYFIKTPGWVKRFFPAYVWHLPAHGKQVYLTFDDGPHPQLTPWILDVLQQYGAKATFFCVGSNVVLYKEVYACILHEGHAVGNHTHTHVNGWKTKTDVYLQDVAQAALHIESALFRPPYGRIKKRQAQNLKGALGNASANIIMWDVLSADFDVSLTPEKCLQNVLTHTEPGSVIVFHDSEKAKRNVMFALPRVLEALSRQGYIFAKIDEAALKKLGPG